MLHDALERSLRLAAAMDARGYGRTGRATSATRRTTAALLLTGLAGLCLGAYELLDPTVPRAAGIGGFAAGTALCVAGLVLGGRRVSRTRYRPDQWQWPEWVVAGSGVASAIVFCLHLGYNPAALNPVIGFPPQWPPLPLLPAVASLVPALAAFAAPPSPVPVVPATSAGVTLSSSSPSPVLGAEPAPREDAGVSP